MGDENKFYSIEFSEKIKTLVVDDDNTCLIITAALLRKRKYQVIIAKNAQDALSILQISGLSFDLVISDVHMPEMHGFQLQQEIAKEYDIPVVFMSADERYSTTMRGLESGAVNFILKPMSEDDIYDLWQFAIMRKNNNKNNYKSVAIDEIGRSSSGLIQKIHPHEVIVVESSSSINKESNNQKRPHEVIEVESSPSVSEESYDKRDKPERKHDEAGNEDNVFTPSKKSKIVWTPSFHSRFLDAITEIGLDKAIPKKIHTFMDVPELTEADVASHLQKYHMYLQKETSNEKIIDNNIQKNSSIQSTLPSKKVESSSLFLDSSNKMTRKSTGNMNATTSAQQFVYEKFDHKAGHSGQSKDKEFSEFMTRHITRKPRIGESTNKEFADLLTGHIKRKTCIDNRPIGTKEFVDLLTGHITQKPRIDNGSFGDKQFVDFVTGHTSHNRANVELPTLQVTFESTRAGTAHDFSTLGNNNHTPISSGIADLTTTFGSQMNVENKDEVGTNLNYVDGINQYQQVDYPWIGPTLAEQGDHKNIVAVEGSSQLYSIPPNLELEKGVYVGVNAAVASFHPHNIAQNLKVVQGDYRGATAEEKLFQYHNLPMNSELEQRNYGSVNAEKKLSQHQNAFMLEVEEGLNYLWQPNLYLSPDNGDQT